MAIGCIAGLDENFSYLNRNGFINYTYGVNDANEGNEYLANLISKQPELFEPELVLGFNVDAWLHGNGGYADTSYHNKTIEIANLNVDNKTHSISGRNGHSRRGILEGVGIATTIFDFIKKNKEKKNFKEILSACVLTTFDQGYGRAANFRHTSFSKLNLTATNMLYAACENANFNETTLNYVNAEAGNFMQANLNKLVANHANFRGARFYGNENSVTHADGSDFSFSDFSPSVKPADLSMMSCVASKFIQSNLYKAKTNNSDFTGSSFVGANLSQVQGHLSIYNDCNFDGANFNGGLFPHTQFVNANLNNTSLNYANFWCDENTSCSFVGATFINAKGKNLAIHSSDLSKANFSFAQLINGEFHHSKLKNTNFTDADLAGSNLACCDVSGANFHQTNLSGVNLMGVINLTPQQLSKAKNLSKIVLRGTFETLVIEDILKAPHKCPKVFFATFEIIRDAIRLQNGLSCLSTYPSKETKLTAEKNKTGSKVSLNPKVKEIIKKPESIAPQPIDNVTVKIKKAVRKKYVWPAPKKHKRSAKQATSPIATSPIYSNVEIFTDEPTVKIETPIIKTDNSNKTDNSKNQKNKSNLQTIGLFAARAATLAVIGTFYALSLSQNNK